MGLSHPDQWCHQALQLGADAATPIEAEAVVAAEWVRMKCLFGCDEPGADRDAGAGAESPAGA